ncbi:hypothetical protein BC827DRAFT_418078 [Russula dissimulans]|nr:hypothetical protein BC827DRAFT_418078 [Russula dissimulans]
MQHWNSTTLQPFRIPYLQSSFHLALYLLSAYHAISLDISLGILLIVGIGNCTIAIVAGIVLFIFNDSWTPLIRQRLNVESVGPDSAPYLFPASALVQKMLSYFLTKLVPAFRNLRRRTATSLPVTRATPRARPALPRSRPEAEARGARWFRVPQLTAPYPVVPRDRRSYHVPSTP